MFTRCHLLRFLWIMFTISTRFQWIQAAMIPRLLTTTVYIFLFLRPHSACGRFYSFTKCQVWALKNLFITEAGPQEVALLWFQRELGFSQRRKLLRRSFREVFLPFFFWEDKIFMGIICICYHLFPQSLYHTLSLTTNLLVTGDIFCMQFCISLGSAFSISLYKILSFKF